MNKFYWILISSIIAAIFTLMGSLAYDRIKNYSSFDVSREDFASSDEKIIATMKIRYSGSSPLTDFEIRFRTQFYYKTRVFFTLLTNDLAESLIAGKPPCQVIAMNESDYPGSAGKVKWFSEIFQCNVLNDGDSLVYKVVQSRLRKQGLSNYEKAMEKGMNGIAFTLISKGTTYSGSCSSPPGSCISGKGPMTVDEVH